MCVLPQPWTPPPPRHRLGCSARWRHWKARTHSSPRSRLSSGRTATHTNKLRIINQNVLLEKPGEHLSFRGILIHLWNWVRKCFPELELRCTMWINRRYRGNVPAVSEEELQAVRMGRLDGLTDIYQPHLQHTHRHTHTHTFVSLHFLFRCLRLWTGFS